jgi:hypothetical protein
LSKVLNNFDKTLIKLTKTIKSCVNTCQIFHKSKLFVWKYISMPCE